MKAKYRVVTVDAARQLVVQEFKGIVALYQWANNAGCECTGLNHNPSNRIELQGEPKFRGLLGPMWDGDAVRYETPRAYNILSS